MQEIYEYLDILTDKPMKTFIAVGNISNKAQSGLTNNNFKLMEYSKNIIRKVGTARNRSDYIHGSQNIQSILHMLKEFKLGNCYENAKTAELILLLNGITNACTAKLKSIDHVVCIFNKDGSQFNGQINNNTIVIDNWAGKTDYAKNMTTHYKNMFKDYFYVPHNAKIEFELFDKLDLSVEKINLIKKQYPDFVLKGKKKFMCFS